eukprot:m.226448 g.226448  ORF g.226448 m.226448 type:complete len:71 (+) comp18797_c2_seq1:406-618(+)
MHLKLGTKCESTKARSDCGLVCCAWPEVGLVFWFHRISNGDAHSHAYNSPCTVASFRLFNRGDPGAAVCV